MDLREKDFAELHKANKLKGLCTTPLPCSVPGKVQGGYVTYLHLKRGRHSII